MFRKLKRIRFLEAQVRGLAEENQRLQVAANEAILRAEALGEKVKILQIKIELLKWKLKNLTSTAL